MIDYILTDEPDIPMSEAFKKSKELVLNSKFKIFTLQLSFIGWCILAVMFTLGIGIIFLTPYIQATMAQLYIELKHNPKTEEKQVQFEQNNITNPEK